ncbi:3'-5' exoribonuclease YhaM family protein [Mycoplasma sp. P36-A1]|uniref:3'-5' exoribonuclease YhaM family protein n=1 Tax=Mycoplasma sp. P36-A1 TaxID=3252900 RepID=UPI003C30E57D
MKYINEFAEGDKIEDIYLISNLVKGKTTSGNDYLSLKLQDKTNEIDSKLWQINKELLDTIKTGMFIKVKANVIDYRDNLQLKLEKIEIVDSATIDMSNYIKTAVLSKEEMHQLLQHFISEINDEVIQKLVKAMLNKYHENLFDYPAASKNHHAYHGGLAYHTVSMLKLASALKKLYPQINKDYLYAGIIMHDLGKIEELSGVVATEYTIKGKLLGHISIVHSELLCIAKAFKVEDLEQTMILEHMILSHHGKLEYGSPVLPMTREAELINYIDNIDARMDTLDKVYESIDPGTFSPRVFPLENRSFYKYKENK